METKQLHRPQLRRLASIVLGLSLVVAWQPASAETASEQFEVAMALLKDAEAARDSGQNQTAIKLFEDAFEQYHELSSQYPSWQPQVTRFRMHYAKEQMQIQLRRGGWIAPKTDAPKAPKAVANTRGAREGDDPARMASAYEARARQLIQDGDPKGARKLLMDALRRSPDDPQLRFLIATAQCQAGQYDDALFILDELAVDQADSAYVAVLQGAAYMGLGDLDKARQRLAFAIKLNGDLAEAHFNMAGLLLVLSPVDLDLALAHYERAIKLGAEPDEGIASFVGFEAAPEPSDPTTDFGVSLEGPLVDIEP
ncbi:MAG: tetratricopeptide repeat protein [Kiritimatiellae bacterium]|nr:tetratricopeptide repeat protein [Kiritimatiellia bacterium]